MVRPDPTAVSWIDPRLQRLQYGQGRNAAHLRALGVALPRISDLADPPSRLAARAEEIAGVDPDRADPRNLFRVHWHNGADRRSLVEVPEHIVLPAALTGVPARIGT